jgi:hypothetical protein
MFEPLLSEEDFAGRAAVSSLKIICGNERNVLDRQEVIR